MINDKQRRALQRVAEGEQSGYHESTLRALLMRGLIAFGAPTAQSSFKCVIGVTPIVITDAGWELLGHPAKIPCFYESRVAFAKANVR